MNRKSLLTIALLAVVISALFLTSCSNNTQQPESNEVNQETQDSVTNDVVDQVDDLLLDENEDVEIGEII